jgi:hypothetical protein
MLGLRPSSVLQLVREARAPGGHVQPLRVYGARADELRDAIAAGGDARLVLLGGDARQASAVVVTAEGEPGTEELAALRTAELHGSPTVAVRLDGTDRPVPYVLAMDVVAWPAGSPPPVESIVERIAARLRRDGRLLAAGLPALRPAVESVLVSDASVRAAVLVAGPWLKGAALPVLTVLQARLLLDLHSARGGEPPASPDELALAVGPRLGVATAVGAAARTSFRRTPHPLRRLAGPALAYAGTRAVATLGSRLPLPR